MDRYASNGDNRQRLLNGHEPGSVVLDYRNAATRPVITANVEMPTTISATPASRPPTVTGVNRRSQPL